MEFSREAAVIFYNQSWLGLAFLRMFCSIYNRSFVRYFPIILFEIVRGKQASNRFFLSFVWSGNSVWSVNTLLVYHCRERSLFWVLCIRLLFFLPLVIHSGMSASCTYLLSSKDDKLPIDENDFASKSHVLIHDKVFSNISFLEYFSLCVHVYVCITVFFKIFKLFFHVLYPFRIYVMLFIFYFKIVLSLLSPVGFACDWCKCLHTCTSPIFAISTMQYVRWTPEYTMTFIS